ncbi:hypothetical protein Dda_5771 [Drechslerella dactyloides]|uniref:GPI inositol-deacylase winged helix domain-containing protein n=1 Tax=Drechslerella dactyloides TaxID=74499 RepID=A0AAD6IUX3_DREDA|nr:hypothetical protein Dda_5771 [Drechslerella dactyloides]
MAQISPRARLDNSEYAIGWIAALPHERAAAQAMLDREHAPVQHKHPKDDNVYSLGSIDGPNGEHNVVIASLPPGKYGATPAATAAAHMLSSFPAIKFGLMVGIGGGIPSDDNDIRLGDVVVSKPEGTFGGVRQFDCGKATINGFEECGILDSPPRVLLNATSALQAQHDMVGSAIPTILEEMYEKYPLMAKPRSGPGYIYQGANHDQLFQSDHKHKDGQRDCSKCDDARKIDRQERFDQEPYIHYGTIASGNHVIKDARIRDSLSKNCLCFETEATGLMNDFPCLVIRGICDYSDSHKNDRWQKYAAATAAAYAKELLRITDAVDVKNTPDIMRKLYPQFSKVYLCLDAMDELRSPRDLLKELRGSPSHIQIFITGRHYIQDTVEEYLTGGQVISIVAHESDIERFVEYEIGGPSDIEPDAMDEELRMNILTKVAGSAQGVFLLPALQLRTVLQATTIRDREAALEILPSDLDEAFGETMDRVKQQPKGLFEKAAKIITWVHLAERPLTVDELLCSLAIKDSDIALDRRGVPVRKTLLNCCHGLVVIDQETSTVRLVHYSLQEYLNRQDRIFDITKEELHMRIARVCLTFLKFPPTTTCACTLCVREIYEATPTSSIAERTLDDNNSTISLFCYAATQWGHHLRRGKHLSNATMELAKEHLHIGLLNNPDSLRMLYEEIDNKRSGYEDINFFKLWIRGDAVYVLPTHIIAFFGIPEIMSYLISTRQDLDARDPVAMQTPLLWAAQEGHEAVVEMLVATGKVCIDSKDDSGSTPLLRAVQYGREAVVRLLIATGKVDINSEDQSGNTPFLTAIRFGHEAAVRLMMATGKVDVDSRDDSGHTPLSWAARYGHEAVVRLLLEAKADVDRVDIWGETPLSRAAQGGHEAVVRLLLAVGANVNSQDGRGKTPLLYAVERGNDDMVKLLLTASGIDVNPRDQYGRTPLSWAAQFGNDTTVKLLLATDEVDIDARDQDNRTPLFLAANREKENVVKLLLATGKVNINAKDHENRTPLSLAARSGNLDVVRLLVATGKADFGYSRHQSQDHW